MLVLSRKQGEAIVIAQDIEVVVLQVRGDRVKLGVRGPSEVSIHRAEVRQRIAEEEAQAATNAAAKSPVRHASCR